MKFNEWIRKVVNTQANKNGNSVCLDDYSKDGMTEYCYPYTFTIGEDEYRWGCSRHHTKGRSLCTHYEIWFSGKAFNGSRKVATGEPTLGKIRKGLKTIYEYYKENGNENHESCEEGV